MHEPLAALRGPCCLILERRPSTSVRWCETAILVHHQPNLSTGPGYLSLGQMRLQKPDIPLAYRRWQFTIDDLLRSLAAVGLNLMANPSNLHLIAVMGSRDRFQAAGFFDKVPWRFDRRAGVENSGEDRPQ